MPSPCTGAGEVLRLRSNPRSVSTPPITVSERVIGYSTVVMNGVEGPLAGVQPKYPNAQP
ncbi:hypothetical protein N7490_006633 [Penicillium lividum]|nr:hypothetical protein N7490_006633 [Penicillium lividum]